MLQVLAWIAVAGIVGVFIHAVRLWFVSRGAAGYAAAPHAADGFLFAFLVPALNEARVIEHTLDRLLALPVRHSLVLIIDDGSNDGTGLLAEARGDPRVRVLRRDFPDARRGKGAALNAGFCQLLQEVGEWCPDRVIVGIMDADGRLDPQAPSQVAAYFREADVGAVQVAVRISNRHDSVLARMQDMEFVTYTDVFQSARDVWGVAGLGGNGQFVRLAAHLDLGPAPWTDGLTEDLEQGLRLVCAGWRIRYCRDVAVHQQGLISGRRLLRQRTRWFQGHLQAWRQIPGIIRRAPLRTIPHLLHALLVPVLLLASVALVAASLTILIGAAISPGVRSHFAPPGAVLGWYWLTFALAVFLAVSAYRRREPGLGYTRAILLGHAFACYSLLWTVVGYWALGRILLGRQSWAKTERLIEQASRTAAEAEPAGTDAS